MIRILAVVCLLSPALLADGPLDRIVADYNRTESGRIVLHGPRLTTSIITNLTPPIAVATYQDGYAATQQLAVAHRYVNPELVNPTNDISRLPPKLRAIIERRRAAAAHTNVVSSAPGSGPVPAARPVTISKAKVAAIVDQLNLTPAFFAWINSRASYATAWYNGASTIVYDPSANGGDLAALVAALGVPTNQVQSLILKCEVSK